MFKPDKHVSYGGNDGYEVEPARRSRIIGKIIFCIGIAAGAMLAVWMYASMFMETGYIDAKTRDAPAAREWRAAIPQ